MQTGIDDQPVGAPYLIGQAPEVTVRVGVETHLLAQAFSVQAPALAERSVVQRAAECGQIKLQRQCRLMVMTGYSLVQGQRLQCVQGLRLKTAGIDKVHPGGAPVCGATNVIGAPPRCIADFVGIACEMAEKARHHAVCSLGHQGGFLHQLLSGASVGLRGRAQLVEKAAETALKAGAGDDLRHFTADTLGFPQAQFVDILRAQVRRGEVIEKIRVVGIATRHAGDSHLLTTRRQVAVAVEGEQFAVGGQHRVGDKRLPAIAQACVLSGRHGIGQRNKGRIQAALLGAFHQQLGNARLHTPQRTAVLREPAVHPGLQRGYLLAIVARKVGQADQVLLVVRKRSKGHVRRRIGEVAVVAKQAGDKEHVVLVAIARALRLALVAEQSRADGILAGQRAGIDSVQSLQHLCIELTTPFTARRAQVG